MSRVNFKAVIHVSSLSAPFQRVKGYRQKGNSTKFMSKTVIDRVVDDDEIAESALRDLLQSEKEEQLDSSIFLLINWNSTKQLFFGEPNLQNGKADKLIIPFFKEIINHVVSFQNNPHPIHLKVVQLQTEQNFAQKEQGVDQNGFICFESVQKASEFLSKCHQKHSQSALAITINQSKTYFRSLFFPFSKKQFFTEILSNFQSQKSLLTRQFSGSSLSRFCIFWSIEKSNIDEVSQQLFILKSKDDKTLLQNVKKEVHRLETTYKKLHEKHRKILSILSKCIDLQSAQIDKKNLLYLDYLPTIDKPNDKLRISTIRKVENDQEIDKLQAEVALLESQIAQIKENHKLKKEEEGSLLSKCEDKKAKLWKNYHNYLNPRVKLEHTNNHNIYWRPSASKANVEGNQSDNQVHNMQSHFSITKNNIISQKNLSRKVVEGKQIATDLKKGIKFCPNIENTLIQQQRFNKGEMIRQVQLKAEIKQLFELISRQEEVIQTIFNKQFPNLKGSLVNLIKGRKKKLFDESIIKQCLLQNCQKNSYRQWVKQQSSHAIFQRELRQKQLAAQTLTTIKQI